MDWNIDYLESVELWLDHLTNRQLKSVAKEIRLLKYCGNNLRLPHSKSLGTGLFELRERGFGLRLYYSFVQNQVILLLLGGNKSSQSNDIE
ncbi:MAG: type II toxin-antitoxin system RelE/ParE family toxin, partial [Gammaproteobacteria bacterium]|nr:type II toxin-antitoxin system RelE/ParE family toxin [Gammaproteobacteria bacterium]